MLSKFKKVFKVDMQKLRSADSSHLFWMDLLMLIIVSLNLVYLFFGFLFQFHFFQNIIHQLSTTFFNWYSTKVYIQVLHYDLIFVLIYITELIFRWIRSIYRKKYDHWWFYPFVHWYDVIMCFPIIHNLNLFGWIRLFGLVFRLQRLGVFDITKTFVFKKSKFVSDVLIEEISDRVIVQMLSMAQEEVQKGSPLVEKIITNVIKPKEDIIVNYLTNRIGVAMNLSYTQYRGELKSYTERVLSESIKENKELKTLNFIPGLGSFIKETLDSAVADITFNTIDKIMKDVINPTNTRGIKEITHALIETFLDEKHGTGQDLNETVISIVTDSIEEVKGVVNQKEWKINQAKEEKYELEEKIRKSQNI